MDNKSLNEAWEKLKGNPSVKRALLVAWVGKHSMVVAGNPDNGKRYLDAIAAGLGVDYSFLNPGLCGNLYDSANVCHCPPKAIENLSHRRSFRQALGSDIAVLLNRPQARDLFTQEPSLETERHGAIPSGELELNQEIPVSRDTRILFEKVYEGHSITLRAHERTLQVAKTIALMGGACAIEPWHAAEAIQYRLELLTR